MRRRFGTVVSSGIRSMLLVWMCLSASAVEYELSGYYEQFDRNPTVEEMRRLHEFKKTHTPVETMAEWAKVRTALATVEPRLQSDMMNRAFKVWVRDRGWCIHTRRPFNELDGGWEHGTADGKVLYTTVGNQTTGGLGIVQELGNPMPRHLTDYGIQMIWMMTASGVYFDTLPNHLTGAAQSESFCNAPNYRPGDGQKWFWLRREGKPGLPMACYFLDGQGRTNFSFRATGFREVGGLSLPRGFIWERYEPRFATPSGWAVRVEERIVARITNIVAHCSRKDLRARVLPNMGGDGSSRETAQLVGHEYFDPCDPGDHYECHLGSREQGVSSA